MDNETLVKDVGVLGAKIHNLSTVVAELQRNQKTLNDAVNETLTLAKLNKLEITEKTSSLRNVVIVAFCLISALGGFGFNNARELLNHQDNSLQAQVDVLNNRVTTLEINANRK